MEMKQFTSEDFMAYAGVDSETPMIGEAKWSEPSSGQAGDVIVIRDGNHVEMYFHTEEDIEAYCVLSRTFHKEEYAAEFCEDLSGLHEPSYMMDVYAFQRMAGSFRPKEAFCPGCKSKIKWDWCHDNFWVEKQGSTHHRDAAGTVLISNGNDGINVAQCPWCKTVIGGIAEDGCAWTLQEHQEVNWEHHLNSTGG
jgi:hypothetical protein